MKKTELRYTLDYVGDVTFDFRWRVTLWAKRSKYVGDTRFMNYSDAVKAARKTGAKPK